MYVGVRPITDFVDMEPEIDPLRDADRPQEWWVTPKGLPREQHYADQETMEQFNESMGCPRSQLFEVHAFSEADKPLSFVLEASCRDVAAAEVRRKYGFRVVSVDVFTTGHEGSDQLPFTVVAGTYERDGDRNYKYIDSFSTLPEAVVALGKVKDYPFHEIEFKDERGVRYIVDLQSIER
jgi:hypothetical protein